MVIDYYKNNQSAFSLKAYMEKVVELIDQN